VSLPDWARWADHDRSLTVGVEEEVMLLDPVSWSLAQAIDELMPRLPPGLGANVRPETHAAAAELGTGVHGTVATAIEELRELRAAGIEIGGHSATHADLSTLSYDGALDELARGQRELEEVLGEPVEVAAYPYGRGGPDTIRAGRDAGFRAACLCTARGSWDDPLALPRQDMGNGSTLLGLRLKRDDRYEPLMHLAPARAVRRVSRRITALR